MKISLIVSVYLADEVGEDRLIIRRAVAAAASIGAVASADDLVVRGKLEDADDGLYAGTGARVG